MYKRRIWILLTIIVLQILFLVGCTTSNENTYTFGEIYDFGENETVNNISLVAFPPIEELFEIGSYEPDIIQLSEEERKELYTCISNLNVKKVEPEEMVTAGNFMLYSLTLGTEDREGKHGYNISIGETYIILEMMDNMDCLNYRHDLLPEEYVELIKILEKISK